MAAIIAVGGQQGYLLPLLAEKDIFRYHKGVLIRIDLELEKAETILEYVSPEPVKAREGEMLFKAQTFTGDCLYLCTTTEILIVSYPSLERIGYISHPMFNDIHHITPTPFGTLAVANCGLDMVIEMTCEGEVLRLFNVLGEEPWQRFSPNIDYRPLSTKPHTAHPNYVFFVDDEMWVTRFNQRDAVSLSHPGRRISIELGKPHDGIVHNDWIYFTTVNGYVVIANKKTLKIEARIDLNSINNFTAPLGWLRGICVDGDKIWVAFSRLRPTKIKENVDWIKRNLKWRLKSYLWSFTKETADPKRKRLGKTRPTRIICYDPMKGKVVRRIIVEEYGISAIFGLFIDS